MTVAGTGGVAALATASNGWTTSELAQDAALTLHAIPVQRASNTITDLVDGITIELKAIGTATITVDRDLEAPKSRISSFVDAYNKVYANIDTARKKGESLEADSALLSMKAQLQAVF